MFAAPPALSMENPPNLVAGIYTITVGMNHPNSGTEPLIGLSATARWAMLPGIIATRRDLVQATHNALEKGRAMREGIR